MSCLSARHLGKRYKQRQVISDVSLNVSSSEIVGLLGPNGAGKTTCFYMIVGLIAADEGQILFDNQDITQQPMHARARLGVGYLPQEPSIFRKLTVADNIKAILQIRQLSKQEVEKELDNLLHEFNIEHLRDSQGISLSGGERRRVEIARAVAANPAFMLLDEPFAGVDPISIGDIKRIIKHLSQRNIGILITDHNVRETLDLCERAYIVGEGKVIAEGNAETVLSNQTVRDIYLGEEFEI